MHRIVHLKLLEVFRTGQGYTELFCIFLRWIKKIKDLDDAEGVSGIPLNSSEGSKNSDDLLNADRSSWCKWTIHQRTAFWHGRLKWYNLWDIAEMSELGSKAPMLCRMEWMQGGEAAHAQPKSKILVFLIHLLGLVHNCYSATALEEFMLEHVLSSS